MLMELEVLNASGVTGNFSRNKYIPKFHQTKVPSPHRVYLYQFNPNFPYFNFYETFIRRQKKKKLNSWSVLCSGI
jgi:hypothetical protein